ncbi:hypothetical protein TrRE_jg1974 [Triparma retinervis]|uniref:Uncharacterized protein n=1 Tax=Triparma retinervis TaxID=2557542 RepID=A0A9W6Z7Z8_9STRA|nr:hypothetical protein TrRE_jg1974 [Triparma retinervis]
MGNLFASCGEVCGGGGDEMAVDKEPLIPSHQGDDDGPEKQEDYKRGRLLDEEQLMNIVNEAKSMMIPLSMGSSTSTTLSPLSVILSSAPPSCESSTTSGVSEVGPGDGGGAGEAADEDEEENKFGEEPLVENL